LSFRLESRFAGRNGEIPFYYMYKKILFTAIIFYIVFFSWFCFWKYTNFGYNGLDLAIYNQVFYKSAHGQLFGLTIHPHSYLGDHFEIFIILLLPFYYLFQSPLTLLILQTIFLASCAWPIFLLVKKNLNEKVGLFVAILWLVNPFVQNINLFEFHLLPFVLFFLFWAFYFFQEKKFWPFLIFVFLSLLVREDVALVIFGFFLLALMEKRAWRWRLVPLIFSLSWLIMATKLTGYFSGLGQYKFLYYYSWLGQTTGEIIKNFFANPTLVLSHLLNWQNFLFIFGLLMPFGYLVIFKAKYLLLAILPALQIMLASENSLVALKTHYSALFLFGLFIALVFELKKILEKTQPNKLEKWLGREKLLLFGLLLTINLYGFFTLGPVLGIFKNNFNKKDVALKKSLTASISPADNLAASFAFLTPLSSRQNLASLHYAYIGKQQFSDIPYQLPENTEKILADTSEIIDYPFIFPEQQDDKSHQNIKNFIEKNNFQPVLVQDSYVLWEKNAVAPFKLYEINPALEEDINLSNLRLTDNLSLLGWQGKLNNGQLPLSFYFKTSAKITADYHLRLAVLNEKKTVIYQKDYALAYGLYPSSAWPIGDLIKINYNFWLPQKLSDNQEISFQLFTKTGFLTLNEIRQVVPGTMEEKIIAQFKILPDKY